VQGGDPRPRSADQGLGRILIRKSGTEPLIRVMAECEDEALLAAVVDEIVGAVEAAVSARWSWTGAAPRNRCAS
jgi:phosphoglucosamine mutase